MDKLIEALQELNEQAKEVIRTMQDIQTDLDAILVSPETQRMLDHLNSLTPEEHMDKAIEYAENDGKVDEDDDSADQPEPIERPELSENV